MGSARRTSGAGSLARRPRPRLRFAASASGRWKTDRTVAPSAARGGASHATVGTTTFRNRRTARPADSFQPHTPPAEGAPPQPRGRQLLARAPAERRGTARPHRVLDAVEAPWSLREEKQLRAAWEHELPSRTEKAQHLIAKVEHIGVEPPHAPEPPSPIEGDDIHLACWMAIVAASSTTRA